MTVLTAIDTVLFTPLPDSSLGDKGRLGKAKGGGFAMAFTYFSGTSAIAPQQRSQMGLSNTVSDRFSGIGSKSSTV